MKEIQREFIITKIKKYENEVNEINKSQTIATVGLGFFTAASLFFAGNIEPNISNSLFNVSGLAINIAFAIERAVNLAEKISEKTGLKNSIRDLNNQLDLDEIGKGLH